MFEILVTVITCGVIFVVGCVWAFVVYVFDLAKRIETAKYWRDRADDNLQKEFNAFQDRRDDDLIIFYKLLDYLKLELVDEPPKKYYRKVKP